MASSFTIKASAGTDVWRKPPTTDIFNAPSTCPSPTKSASRLSTLTSARTSFRLPQDLKQYDQAGLLLSLRPAAHPSPSSSSSSPPKWIKAGVENYDGAPRAAVVACDAWADWSLAPVVVDGQGWVTVAVESAGDGLGRSLWVYQVVGEDGVGVGEKKVPLREVCWPFGHGAADEWEVTVEAYACRPSKEGSEELEVEFRGFEVKWT